MPRFSRSVLFTPRMARRAEQGSGGGSMPEQRLPLSVVIFDCSRGVGGLCSFRPSRIAAPVRYSPGGETRRVGEGRRLRAGVPGGGGDGRALGPHRPRALRGGRRRGGDRRAREERRGGERSYVKPGVPLRRGGPGQRRGLSGGGRAGPGSRGGDGDRQAAIAAREAAGQPLGQ